MPLDTNHGNFSDRLSIYEDLLANIPTAIYRFRVTASGGWRFDFVNRAFCELTGLDREDIFDDYETVFRLIHPDELDSFISLNKSAQKTNTPFNWEGRSIVHGENRWIRVQSSPTPMDNGEVVWSGYFVDITDSKRAEEERRLLQENLEKLVAERTANLRENEQKLRTINDSALDAIILINDKGEIFSWNHASERLFGYRSSEVMGKNVHELLAPAEYRPAYRSAFKDFVLTGHGNAVGRITELVALRKDGKPFPIEISLSSFQIDGRWQASGIIRDISERKRVEERLQDEKDKLKNILDHMIDGVYILNANYDIEYLNPALASLGGDIAGRKCFEYLASLNAPCPWCKNRQVFDGESLIWERTSSSTGKTYDIFETPIRNTDGSISKLSILHDITKRKEAEASLRDNSAFLRTLINAIPAPIFYKDTDGHYMGFNKSFEEFFGKTEQELVGKSVFDIYPREFAEIFRAKDLELFNNQGVQVYESQITDAGGAVHDVVFHKSTFSNSQGNVIGLLGVIIDITERKRSENTLRESERFLRQSEKIAHTGGWKANPFTDRLYWTEGVYDICEAPKDYQPGLDEGLEFYTPPYRPILKEAVAKTIEQGEPFTIEAEVITTTGKHLWTEVRGLMRVEDGEEPQVVGTFQDVTERKLAESDRRRLSTAIEQAAEAVIITDVRGIIEYVNRSQEILSGYGIDELVGQMPNVLNSDFHEANFCEQIWDTIGVGKAWSGRFINRKKDGNEYHQEATISPIFDNSGNLTNFIVGQHDVTKQVELQEQLFQAQKMEAIGTLAGGFAHDFNNKLQVIAGYVELILCNEELPENLKHDIDQIGQAVHASAELIREMLVFSRKTTVKFERLYLNTLVTRLRSMLVPVMPKMITIDLVLAGDLWPINAAPNQIDQVLMNLSVNARDAMPEGGKLIIQTQNTIWDEEYCRYHPNTKPGRYVLLSVTDTGSGMDAGTVKRIFEPFFTTKEEGKGTGLGLAVVYGIVEKHGGNIICDSDPSVGTTFKIFLPATEEVTEEEHSEKTEPPKGQGDTILLVDDEPNVLEIFSRLLREANYRVIKASNGKDALELYEKHGGEIGLVCLDLLMPGMDGKDCLRTLLGIDPKARVLVVSGALNEGMVQELKEAGASGVILKPFDMGRMLEKIRQIIDGE